MPSLWNRWYRSRQLKRKIDCIEQKTSTQFSQGWHQTPCVRWWQCSVIERPTIEPWHPAKISSKNNRLNVYIRKSIGAKRERRRRRRKFSLGGLLLPIKKKVLFQYSNVCLIRPHRIKSRNGKKKKVIIIEWSICVCMLYSTHSIGMKNTMKDICCYRFV